MKEILLDTNAYTRYLSGDQKVLDVIAAAEIIYMSVFVLGELRFVYSLVHWFKKYYVYKKTEGEKFHCCFVYPMNAFMSCPGFFTMLSNISR